jgi:hypothetical protein
MLLFIGLHGLSSEYPFRFFPPVPEELVRNRRYSGYVPVPDPLFICEDPSPVPDPSINKQKMKKALDFYCIVTSL